MFRNILSLAFQGATRKRRSSILVFLVLLISFSFAIVSVSLVGSISRTNAEFRLNTYGEWYLAIPSGLEKDSQWLQDCQWAQTIGIAHNYGSVIVPAGQIGFGTVDDSLIEAGRLNLDDGHWPTRENELAMEARSLSELGYDYTLGQEITLRIEIPWGDSSIAVERPFTLCGIIREYTNLWMLKHNNDNRLLVSAVVTRTAADQVLEAANAYAPSDSQEKQTAADAIPQYFITVEEGNRSTALEQLTGWMKATRSSGAFGDLHPCENDVAYPDSITMPYQHFYIYAITVVVLLAVLCVYIMQLPAETHSFAVLRSIGITKWQMAWLLLTESLILCLPAIIIGIPCGIGFTWLFLRLLMYSGSAPIQVSVPYGVLLPIMLLWIAMVLLSRLIVYCVIVHTPLTGRLQLQNAKSRRARAFRNGLIIFLLGVFGAVTIFTSLESRRPDYNRKWWSSCPSYVLWADSSISRTKTDLIEQVPGVLDTNGFGEMKIGLSFPGIKERTVMIYALDEMEWDITFNFGMDREAFHNGELVLMCFPDFTQEDDLLPEGDIQLRVYDGSGDLLTEAGPTPVSIRWLPENAMNRLLAGLWEPYTVICSNAYLENLLSAMEPGKRWDKYTAGEEFGYDRVYVSVDMNAGDLSTDFVVAELCKQNGITFSNRRQETMAHIQENLQVLILLYGSAGCIGLTLLLILCSALRLETEQEKQYFGIMRVIGMSSRQMSGRIWGKALGRSGAAVAIGWVLYGGYVIVKGMMVGKPFLVAIAENIQDLKYNGYEISFGLFISGVCLVTPLLISLLVKHRLKKGILQ